MVASRSADLKCRGGGHEGWWMCEGSLPTCIATIYAHDGTTACVADDASGVLQHTAVAADEIAEKQRAACPVAGLAPIQLPLQFADCSVH